MAVVRTILITAAGLVFAATAGAAPEIGYLYPAGGQQGTVVRVTVGGQFLRGPRQVHCTGDGVSAKVIQYYRPVFNLNGDQRKVIQDKLAEVRAARLREQPAPVRAAMAKAAPKGRDGQQAATPETDPVALPDHPLLHEIDQKSLRQLAHLQRMIFMPRSKLQPNRQLAETVLLEVTIAPDAAAGFRELRLETADGLSSPMVFQVGTLPEKYELEPNDTEAYETIRELSELPRPDPLTLPVMLNGQIQPGDVDRFCFAARKGQTLVMQTFARRLIPYLADAVPGWFQATVTLYTAAGEEIAFADDFRFDPDPVLVYEITRDGQYELEIRDAIYRGRDDFVYRIAVGELPFITQLFPLGGKKGTETIATVDGWNLPHKQVSLDTAAGPKQIRRVVLKNDNLLSNAVPYAVDDVPECHEKEANNAVETAQMINLPTLVNGRIDPPGDTDVFQFTAGAGDVITAEVYARRLNSPLDALLRLTDASGKVIEWNDDYVLKDAHLYKDAAGLSTHHADAYLNVKLPAAGTYYVHLSDSQNHGGPAFGYRLQVKPAQPDFALRVTPSSLTIPAGSIEPITVHVLRKNGFEGPIEVSLKDAPAGFELHGHQIPAGCDRLRMTLASPPSPLSAPVNLTWQGRGHVNGQTVTRDAVAADDRMQAFLYRHLVPSEQCWVQVPKKRWGLSSVTVTGLPVKVPLGGSVQVTLKTARRPVLNEIRLQLQNPPNGLTLGDVTVVPEGLALTLKADKEQLAAGFADNLIIEAFREYTPKPKDGQPAPKQRRDAMGVIRALPIQVVDVPQAKTTSAQPAVPPTGQ